MGGRGLRPPKITKSLHVGKMLWGAKCFCVGHFGGRWVCCPPVAHVKMPWTKGFPPKYFANIKGFLLFVGGRGGDGRPPGTCQNAPKQKLSPPESPQKLMDKTDSICCLKCVLHFLRAFLDPTPQDTAKNQTFLSWFEKMHRASHIFHLGDENVMRSRGGEPLVPVRTNARLIPRLFLRIITNDLP